jgi:hypothetical protein
MRIWIHNTDNLFFLILYILGGKRSGHWRMKRGCENAGLLLCSHQWLLKDELNLHASKIWWKDRGCEHVNMATALEAVI